MHPEPMTPTKTAWREPREPRAPAEGDDIAVPAQHVIYCQCVCVRVHVREIAPKTETRKTKRQIWVGVQDVPTVTRLSVRKECIP